MAASSGWRIVGAVLVALCVVLRWSIDWKQMEMLPSPAQEDCRLAASEAGSNSTTKSVNSAVAAAFSTSSIVSATDRLDSISPGELPGYTGWGRPEWTLAKFFRLADVPHDSLRAGETFVVTVECHGHDACNKDASLFFLRAYGPAIVPGTFESRGEGTYQLIYILQDPGTYTVEAVLTFSNPPSIASFPLNSWAQPAYEGYLLPGFPIFVAVEETSTHLAPSESINSTSNVNRNLCEFSDLVETSSNSAVQKARWKVTGRSNGPGYVSSTLKDPVTKGGYEWGRNSMGVFTDYRHTSNCYTLPESVFALDLGSNRAFSSCQKRNSKIQIVYIGDSVLRVQKDMLVGLTKGMKSIELEFLSLHEGYRKNQKLGPSNIQSFLKDMQDKAPQATRVILFNTGLHDIHRLCGFEFASQRRDYIDNSLLDSGSFRCIEEYRLLLNDFAGVVKAFPAQLKVFQTTTAAWPKYGNYGVAWDHQQQSMPLVSDFAAAFNDVAYDVLSAYKKDGIEMMDGYWITYARPDNREFGDIGKKLSHPGRDVLSAMARRWAMMILYRLC